MKPKEKAEKLVSDFYTINCKLIKVKFPYDRVNRYNKVMPIAKECALIAVDEILSAICFNMYDEDAYNKEVDYWEEVKREIKKL